MQIFNILKRVVQLPWAIKRTILPVVNAPSYYPELPRKSAPRRFMEILYSFIRRKWQPFYNAYGLDLAGNPYGSANQYISEDEFWNKMITPYYSLKSNHSIVVNHAVVLRDKLLFGKFMKLHGIRTPEIFAYSKCGRFYVGNKEVTYAEWIDSWRYFPSPFFLKEGMNCCGHGIYKIEVLDGQLVFPQDFIPKEEFFKESDFLLQESVVNHSAIAEIYPKSLNTARIVTVWDDETRNPVLLTQALRIGATGNYVDNWAAGGLVCGILDDGVLNAYGYLKPTANMLKGVLKVDCHPDTGVKFKDRSIPNYRDGIELVLKAHSLLPEIKSIGWDLAFTPSGPVIIEGNEDWEISLMQIVGGGGVANKARGYFNLM